MSLTLQTLPRLTTYSMRAISAANVLTPAFGGAVQRLARKGARFALDVSIPAISAGACGMGLVTDLLLGETETLVLAIPESLPTVAYGTPLAVGVVSGSILPTDGLPAGTLIRKGKFFSIILSGQRFVHIVTADTTADGVGAASLPIWPMLRRPTIDNAVVELATPKIEGFVAAGQDWSLSRLASLGLSFTIEERE